MALNLTDPYEPIAQFYDLEHASFRADAEFYINLLDRSPILEVGAGAGRIMQPLLEARHEVWGIDPSARMLEIAKKRLDRHPRAHFVQSSILDLDLAQRFPSVIFPLNVLWHLRNADEQLAALQIAARHLDPDGMFCIDLTNPLSMADRGANGELRLRFQHQEGQRTVVGLSAAWDDEAEQRLRLHMIYDETDSEGHTVRTQSVLNLRYMLRSELELMLRLAGLRVQQIYGSYDLDPYDAGSANLIVIASREPPRTERQSPLPGAPRE